MSYIGNSSTQQTYAPAVDYFNGDGSTVAFTLSRPVLSVAQMVVVVANVIQNPGSAFTVNGTTITFTSAPPSGTNNVWVEYVSPNTQLIAPGQGTVTTTSLGNITNIASGNSSLTLQTGTTPTTAMTIDTSQNVGIGTSSPSAKLDVRNTGGLLANFQNTGGTNAYIYLQDTARSYAMFSNNGAWGVYDNTGGTERMRIDSSGRVTMPYQPAFYARFANDAFNYGSGDTIWDQAVLNVGGHYNTSNGRFTAPVAGVYVFALQVQHYGGTASSGYQDILINGSAVNCRYEHASGANYTAASCTLVYYLNAGDYAVCSSSSAVWWSDNSYFCGYLLG